MLLKDKILKLEELDKEIGVLTSEIKELEKPRAELVKEIIDELEHNHQGQKTYDLDEYKLTVTTPYTYSLNATEFEKLKSKIPAKYNPVKESIKYTVSKTQFDAFVKEAPATVKRILATVVDVKAGKQNIKIGFVK